MVYSLSIYCIWLADFSNCLNGISIAFLVQSVDRIKQIKGFRGLGWSRGISRRGRLEGDRCRKAIAVTIRSLDRTGFLSRSLFSRLIAIGSFDLSTRLIGLSLR